MMEAQDWLLKRLQDHGIDVYEPKGPFACLRDRLARVILDNRYGAIVAGRHEKRPETYAALFLRIYGTTLENASCGPVPNTDRLLRDIGK